MLTYLIGMSIAVAPPCQNDGHNQNRSQAALRAFKKAHHCPGGKDKGSTTRCGGYVVDHICPLACCGQDAPSNMQWQTTAKSKIKDKTELNCKLCTKTKLKQ
jgi:hypothetical protein